MAVSDLGRRRGPAPSRRRSVATLALLAMLPLVAELQRVADYVTLGFIADREGLRSPSAHWLFQGQIAALCLGPAIGGVLVGILGVRRTVALTVVGWCMLVSVGVGLVDPLRYRLWAPLVGELVPGVILCAALVALVRLLDSRRRGPAAMVILLLFAAARERPHLATAMLRTVAVGWQEMMFLLVAIGAFVAAVWLAAFQEAPAIERGGTIPPGTLIIAAGAVAWSALVLAVLAPPTLAPPTPGLPALAVALTAAAATDRFRRSIGRPPASRAMALLPGFLLAALVGVADGIGGMTAAVGGVAVPVAGGLLQVAGLLSVDCAPRRAPGLFIGLVLTADLAAIRYLGPLARSHVSHEALLVAAGLGGAAWCALLPRLSAGSAGGGRRSDSARQAAAGVEQEERDDGHGGADAGQAGVA